MLYCARARAALAQYHCARPVLGSDGIRPAMARVDIDHRDPTGDQRMVCVIVDRKHAASKCRRGRTGQCHRRKSDAHRTGNSDQRAAGYSGERLSGRIWAPQPAGGKRALYQRYSAQRAVDCDRSVCVRALCCAFQTFRRRGGGNRACDSANPDDCAHYRKYAQAGARRIARSRVCTGRAEVEMIGAIALKAAASGIVTGCLLSVARISGETAPLLFTVLSNHFFSADLRQPMATLPVTIFQFAMSPYAKWQKLAWDGVLLMTLFILGLNTLARLAFRKKTDT